MRCFYFMQKLSGESQENGTSHLRVLARLFPARLFLAISNGMPLDLETRNQNEAILFLSNLFLYNDLVRSTSLRTSTLSSFYLRETRVKPASAEDDDPRRTPRHRSQESAGRFCFPNIIARIGSGDFSVTDADIAAWDGRLDWLPSFALQSQGEDQYYDRLPTADAARVYGVNFQDLETFTLASQWSEGKLVSELYRVAATVYRKQCRVDQDAKNMGNLPHWAIGLIRLLPTDSRYETALLWPAAIAAQELVSVQDREDVLARLLSLEQRFKMKNFRVVREHLLGTWGFRDTGISHAYMQPVLFG